MTDIPFTRRHFLGLAGAGLAASALSACNVSGESSPGSQSAAASLKFWDMPWGTPAYTDAARAAVEAYKPPDGLPAASYQAISWTNYYQTFSSAIAAGTGPAVSTGAGFQAHQFAEQNAIAYADQLIETLKSDGTYDDFLPGVLDTMKTAKGYVAVPWLVDVRALWYNQALLDKAGVEVPTDWDSLRSAGKALRKIGVSGFSIGAGAGNNLGSHILVSMMINNAGGMFTPDRQPDCVTDRNIEAMEFVRELVADGTIDKGAVSYTSDNMSDQWSKQKAAIGFNTPGLANAAVGVKDKLHVASPITGPHGDKGSVLFVGPLMMYAKTPSQKGPEAFVHYYIGQWKGLWEKQLVSSLPVLKTITQTSTFKADAAAAKITDEWIPICKTYAARGTEMFGALAAVDGGQALSQFTQTILEGSTDARTALTNLQKGLESIVK